MAACKHIRWCASLLNGARGRGFSTESLGGTSTSGQLFAAIEPHVKESGRSVFSNLKNIWEREMLEAEKEKGYLRELLQNERELLQKGRENQKELRQKDRELLQIQKELLQKERELRAQNIIDLLRAQGLNDTRGLFEHIQEVLARQSNITSRPTGAGLWEAILKEKPDMAKCIENCTKVPASNVSKQALNCYSVYLILSQHVHAGKTLAEILLAQGGTIVFERGPLSPEQARVFECMGNAAQVKIAENTGVEKD